jgi:hypothetical protein
MPSSGLIHLNIMASSGPPEIHMVVDVVVTPDIKKFRKANRVPSRIAPGKAGPQG